MKKKDLLKRILVLEACLGRRVDIEQDLLKRIQDLEEIVFDVNLCESTPVGIPDRTSN